VKPVVPSSAAIRAHVSIEGATNAQRATADDVLDGVRVEGLDGKTSAVIIKGSHLSPVIDPGNAACIKRLAVCLSL